MGHGVHKKGHHGGHGIYYPWLYKHYYPSFPSYRYYLGYGGGYGGYDYYYPDRTDRLLVVEETAAIETAPAAETTPEGLEYLRRAEEAFRSGQYDRAVRLVHHGLVEMPRHGRGFLLLAQGLLAVGDYRGAAAAVHQATTLLEPDDWGHVVVNFRRYYGSNDYAGQINRLTTFIRENPDAAYACLSGCAAHRCYTNSWITR